MKMKRIRNAALRFCAACLFSTAALAQTPEALTAGEVRKIDRDAGKITIRHGPIRNLDMPAMTMVFRVDNPALLDPLKVGDRIHFVADKINGAYTAVRIEPAKP